MKLFVWDFHGVLEKDNELAVIEVCDKVLKEFGINKKINMDFIIDIYGKSYTVYFRRLSPDSDDETINKMIERANVVSKDITEKYIKPKDNARYVLENIKERGDINVVLSNSRQKRLESHINAIGLDDLVDEAVGLGRAQKGKDFENFDIGKYKENKIIELKEKFKVEECIVTGDNEWDVEAGNKTDSTTFLFSPKNKNIESKADFVVDNLKDILRVYGD